MNVVIVASDQLLEQIKQYYSSELDHENNIPHTKFVVTTKDLKVIAYQSNKVMFQGKDASKQASLWEAQSMLNIAVSPSEKAIKNNNCFVVTNESEHIGSDEVGTGDYFGPVVVCASYLNEDIVKQVSQLNLQDSKKLDDFQIRELAKTLKKIVPHVVYVLDNKKYNEAIMANNLNVIKAKMHNYVLLKLIKLIDKKPMVVVDQFCLPETYYSYLKDTKNVVDNICFETKAEDKYLAVAIASIIARDAFLAQMDQISDKIGMKIQKGASDLVDTQGVEIIKTHGWAIMNDIAKLHFVNTQKIKDKIKQEE
ncbi:ribonuclease HIII [Erysipelotrichaceae bacterium OttesenSCG-928-M19]|nr:ribonuclease HIII [Erysipelotrichaceae bacterium OttesenSCG-928-M19]